MDLSRKKWLLKSQARAKPKTRNGYLRIGDVAKLIGISPSTLRTWEKLGLAQPARTQSKYRLYTHEDVRLLKKALFLRRVRGLNAPAIFESLKTRGLLRPGYGAAPAPIGSRLRSLRLGRGESLSTVAAAVNISVGFLSSLERSQMSASVSKLRKLAQYYNINILDFFDTAAPNSRRVRPAQRKSLEAGPGVQMELLAWGSTVMEPHLFRIAPKAGSGESYSHEGEEFLYILKGELHISVDNEEYSLKRGDSFYFESTTSHRWSNPGKTETLVLWVNTPPTF